MKGLAVFAAFFAVAPGIFLLLDIALFKGQGISFFYGG